MIIRRWKHATAKQHMFGILQGFAEIADGLVTVGSFGFFASGFEMAVARRRSLSHLQGIKKRSAVHVPNNSD